MKSPRTATRKRPAIEAGDVETWLLAHPDFLAQRPELYLALEPPQRVHGERMADHMAAMLAAARVHMREVDAEAQQQVRQSNPAFATRAGEAVLALLRAPDTLECIAREWPAILGVEACHVGCEAAQRRHVVRLAAGTLSQLLPPGRDAVVRSAPLHVEPLHKEAAPVIRRDALARVPAPGGQPMLLAIGARDAEMLPAAAVESIAFLGRAVGAALAR